jgi:hypothetical protein
MRKQYIPVSLVAAILVGYGYARTSARPLQVLQPSRSQATVSETFIQIDDPKGARGTRAWGIDPEGDVVGSYDDSNKVRHGFFWHNGTFTTIDDPHAGHGQPGPLGPEGTTLYDINAAGDITGRFVDSTHEAHAFLLHRGVFTTLDDPAAGEGRGRGTQADGMNDAGDIVGDYIDPQFVVHGYVLHSGQYTTIDAPHAERGRYVGTHAFSINRRGDIVLFTEPGKHNPRGFLLSEGRFIRMDDPHGKFGTFLQGINEHGIIVGLWIDGKNVEHGLVLCNGVFTTHDDPNAGRSPGQGTQLNKINPSGAIAGWYVDSHKVDHGFLLRPGEEPGSCSPDV